MRAFGLSPEAGGSTRFSMEERFTGLMLPLVKGTLPDFGPIFQRFAMDLKQEAERVRQPAALS